MYTYLDCCCKFPLTCEQFDYAFYDNVLRSPSKLIVLTSMFCTGKMISNDFKRFIYDI